jgi:hypothetical protein
MKNYSRRHAPFCENKKNKTKKNNSKCSFPHGADKTRKNKKIATQGSQRRGINLLSRFIPQGSVPQGSQGRASKGQVSVSFSRGSALRPLRSRQKTRKMKDIKNVKKIIAKKILTDTETNKLIGTMLSDKSYTMLINYDADVYDNDGKLILRFRKNVLPHKTINDAYDNMIVHARQKTTTRGNVGGPTGKLKIVNNNNKIASNILGYFDTLSLRQKYIFREANMKKPICRETSFTAQQPEKWRKIVPLIKEINNQYKKLFPVEYKKQYKAAQSTKYVIDNTTFSTVTTNLNLQTAVHTDKGDYKDGVGNLVVIERGKYIGGYTVFPQYGIAVDVRQGDFLGMDVHQPHGNTAIRGINGSLFERLSIVSYLREGIVNKCANEPFYDNSYFEKAREIVRNKKK